MSEPKKLSEGELIEISTRLRKATRGDWMPSPPTSVLGSGVVSAPTGRVVAMGVASNEDAEFIATAHQDVEKLLVHINLMEAEQRAVASRTASDAFEVGHANATFIERQTGYVQTLETGIKSLLAAVEIDPERRMIDIHMPNHVYGWLLDEPIENPLVNAILALHFLVKDISK